MPIPIDSYKGHPYSLTDDLDMLETLMMIRCSYQVSQLGKVEPPRAKVCGFLRRKVKFIKRKKEEEIWANQKP